MADESEEIAVVRKNGHEVFRITRESYRGQTFAQLRWWFDAGEGEMRLGRAGVAIQPSKLDEVIAGLQTARLKLLGGGAL